MKLWLQKKKKIFWTLVATKCSSNSKKIGYDDSLLFLHMQLEKTYFFFLSSQFWPWEKQKYA